MIKKQLVQKGTIALAAMFIGLIPIQSFAGSWNGWVYQTPYPSKSALLSVKFVTPLKGWVVGQEGTILFTMDGGKTWAAQESGVGQDLKSVFFINEKSGWAVGNGGTIIHTEDGGTTWRPQGEVAASLHKVFFLNDTEGWAVGDVGTVLHTTNRGKKWDKLNSGIWRHIAGIYFLNPETGWILAGDEIYRTMNGGKNWEKVKLDIKLQRSDLAGGSSISAMNREGIPPDWTEGDIFFSDSKTGWAVLGTWQIFHTSDGGKTWTPKDMGYMSYGLGVISFNDEKRGCVAGTTIFCTEDGGKTWREKLGVKPREREKIDGFMISIWGLSFGQGTGWAVGAEGQILKTEDGGKSWNMVSRGPDKFNFYFSDRRTGWAVSYNYGENKSSIVNTVDGGATWKVQREFKTRALIDFFFINSSIGWAAGQELKEDRYKGSMIDNYFILHTTDGGTTWISQFKESGKGTRGSSEDFQDVCFINKERGWAVGTNGLILHTKDGGKHWKRQVSGTKSELRSVQFVDSENGWVIGNEVKQGEATSIILHTSDGGKSWHVQWKEEADWMWLSELFFMDKDTGWAVGDVAEYSGSGMIIHTTDSGKSWSKKEFSEIYFKQLYFHDIDCGVALTGKGSMLITNDGGGAWSKVPQPLRPYPWHVSEIFGVKK